MKLPFLTFKIAFTLVIMSLGNSVIFAATIEDKKQIAMKVFPTPGAEAKWEIFEQPFWKHSVIFHLVSVSDPHWVHRPFVAVDEQNKGYLLSEHALKMSQPSLIQNFNHLTLQEHIEITKANIEEYARFFGEVSALPSWAGQDRINMMQMNLSQEKDEERRKESQKVLDDLIASKKEGLRYSVNPNGENFFVTYFWRDGEYSLHSDILIHRDGTVDFQGKKD